MSLHEYPKPLPKDIREADTMITDIKKILKEHKSYPSVSFNYATKDFEKIVPLIHKHFKEYGVKMINRRINGKDINIQLRITNW